jgi:CHAD domain-containing protein
MATVTFLAGAHPSKDAHRGLSYSMDRVLSELENFREMARASTRQDSHRPARSASNHSANPATRESAKNEDAVHDLRVSIRRCRSIAGVMEEIDPDPAWPEMRRAAKKLFQGLGSLRDGQVMQTWVEKLASPNDPVAAQLRSEFVAGEPHLLEKALHAARKFDGKNWKRLERVLRRRSRLVPIGGLAAECLAFERFEAAKAMHARALRSEKSKPWHELRGYMKRFRYTVENLLPEHHALWRDNLKRVQDLLGDLHDLDVLADYVAALAAPDSELGADLDPQTAVNPHADFDLDVDHFETARHAWSAMLERERAARIATYRQLTLGTTSLWSTWRHALPHGERLQAAALARLRATARSADPRLGRTRRNARLARSLFDSLGRAKAGALFSDPRARQLLQAAAVLQNARGKAARKSANVKSPHKSAHRFLAGLAMPPGFSEEDWSVLLATVRYHRGAEPGETSSVFSELSPDRQKTVRALAGALRLARALRKSGVNPAARLRAENTDEAVVLRVPDLPDNVESATRFAAAKHLLEIYLGKAVVLRPAPNAVVAPVPSAQNVLVRFATASD